MKISVIVPVYKVEKYIHRCVDSILNQTFSDFELILVDDGSPDNCGKICDEYAQKDNRVIVIHKENGGLSDARNAGIDWAFENSDSEWITFVDSDDWLHTDYLRTMYEAALTHEVSFVTCRYKEVREDHVDDSDAPIVFHKRTPEEFYVDFRGNIWSAWCRLYKKAFFSGIRYPFGKLNEDAFVTYKIIFAEQYIAYTDAELYYYYQSPNSIMRSKWDPRKLAQLEAYELELDYFLENGFHKAYEKTVMNYVYIVACQISAAHQVPEYKKYYSDLTKRLNGLLHQYADILGDSAESMCLTSVDRQHYDIGQKMKMVKYVLKYRGFGGLFRVMFKKYAK